MLLQVFLSFIPIHTDNQWKGFSQMLRAARNLSPLAHEHHCERIQQLIISIYLRKLARTSLKGLNYQSSYGKIIDVVLSKTFDMYLKNFRNQAIQNNCI